jgi:hypothetical protein
MLIKVSNIGFRQGINKTISKIKELKLSKNVLKSSVVKEKLYFHFLWENNLLCVVSISFFFV